MKSISGRSILLIAFLVLASLHGCATRLEMGAPPRVERLELLTPHVSTRNDVLITLGEPRGHGAAHLSPSSSRQEVWFYEHSVSEGMDIRFSMLLVFFSGDVYDGYMWFADAVNLQEYAGGKRR